MISLKAICTSSKKSSLFLILLLVILIPVSGASFRIAVIEENSSYFSLFEDVISAISPNISSEFALNSVSKRLENDSLNTYNLSRNRYLESENFTSLERLSLQDIDSSVDSIEILLPDFSDVEKKYLLSGDREAIEYIKLRDNYDMIIVIAENSNDIIPEIALYIDGELTREALFNSTLLESEEAALFDIFSSLFLSDDYAIIDVDFPKNGTLYIDGEEETIYTSKIALKKGEHDISYIIPGFISKEFTIYIGDETESLELNLEEVPPTSLSFSTTPFDAKVYYNGLFFPERTIEKLEYPFTITATHDGFSLYSMQSMVPVDNLTITLKPAWMDSENILEQSKGDFYMNLFMTLMSFGSYIAMQTVTNLKPEYNLAPVSVVLGGISLVSLINMVDSMFEYFESARYGI